MAIELAGALGDEVAAWAVDAGWRVVDRATGVEPRIAPAPSLLLAAAVEPDLPSVIVIDGDVTTDDLRAGLAAGALDVIGWPDDRGRLLGLAATSGTDAPLPAAGRPWTDSGRAQRPIGPAGGAPADRARGGPRRITVAGAAGGTGASTVTLAIGALLAWGGRRTIVVGGEDLLALCALDPWRGPGAPELSLLDGAGAAAELPQLTRDVPGVPRLAVLGGGALELATAGWPCDAVVIDLRTEGRAVADVVCARPDVHLAGAADSPGAVLLVGDGPLSPGQARAALGRRPAGTLPSSARVARAGVRGRVPSGLPGSWLGVLRETLVGAPR